MNQPSAFRTDYSGFLLSEERRVNWRNVEKTDVARILAVRDRQGDLRDLNNCLEELAYTDLEKDPYISTSQDAHKALKTMQFGLQYLLFTQSILKRNLTKLNESVQTEKTHMDKLAKVAHHQKRKMKKLEGELERMDQRAHHYDMMSDFLRPHLDRQLDFKKTEAHRLPKETEPRRPPKDLTEPSRPSFSQDWLESGDFELSGSLGGDRLSSHAFRPINVITEEDQTQLNRFNSPGTGIEGMYSSPPLSKDEELKPPLLPPSDLEEGQVSWPAPR